MQEIERRFSDERRTGADRRQMMMKKSKDRREKEERRWPVEHRAGYARINQWKSVLLGIEVSEMAEIIAFR